MLATSRHLINGSLSPTHKTGSLIHWINALSFILTCLPHGQDSPKRSIPQLFTAAPLGGLKPSPIQRL